MPLFRKKSSKARDETAGKAAAAAVSEADAAAAAAAQQQEEEEAAPKAPPPACLHEAARLGDVAALREMCLADPAAVGSKCEEGYSPMHLAVMSGRVEAIMMLLAFGGDPDSVAAENGETPLHLAVESEQLEAVQVGRPGMARLGPLSFV
jgi:ankyrin repeat protein